jgi:hypothetical protein
LEAAATLNPRFAPCIRRINLWASLVDEQIGRFQGRAARLPPIHRLANHRFFDRLSAAPQLRDSA